MNSDKKKGQKDPSKENIKFILELFNSSKLIDAKKEIDKQIIKYPNSSILFNILGAVLASQNQFDKAVENYKRSIKINPNYAQAYNNLGIVFHKLDKINEAVDKYRKAISLNSDFAEAFHNLGNAFRELNKPTDALSYFKKAIKIKPNYVEAFNSLGETNQILLNKKEALANFQEAIKIKPNYAEAYNNLGLLLDDLIRFDESLSSYNKAIKLKPNYEKPYNNLGNLLSDLGKYDEANDLYLKAIKIKPDYAKAYSNLLFNYNYMINYDPNLYLSYAKKYRSNCKVIKKSLSFKYQYEENPKKLKLGFVSADFGNHPGGFFTLSTLRELRKKNFELVSYATIDRNDEFSPHFKPLFSKWNSIKEKKDIEVVEQIFKDGIHILIDSQGHSAGNRLSIFMYKAAPIQASWLSQGSLGIPEVDYFIGSPHVTPKNEENHYVEKILRLPEISQVFTPPDFEVTTDSLPALKNNFVTFGCINKLAKIHDEVILLWSKILLTVSNSKLLIKNRNLKNNEVNENICSKFEKHNIKRNRLILIDETKTRRENLEVFNQIDIALDPFPFQGNTSTCEAVWMGVPVLTLKGDRFLFHFGESINSNLNMHDWIAKNYEEYVSKAVKFSSDLNELSKIRKNLRQIALQSPVFDAPRFTEHFSKMLWDMWHNFSRKAEFKKH